MCITNEVEPRAETFSSVVLCSTKKAMKMKLRSGQMPGEGWRYCQATKPSTSAIRAVKPTNK